MEELEGKLLPVATTAGLVLHCPGMETPEPVGEFQVATCLALLHSLVNLVTLDIVHIPFPIVCPIDISNAIALCIIM